MSQVLTKKEVHPLTQREWEVLAGIADGRTAAEIAQELEMSPRTVSTHLRNIFAKLGVHNRAAAVYAGFALLLRSDPWLDLGDYHRVHNDWPPSPPN